MHIDKLRQKHHTRILHVIWGAAGSRGVYTRAKEGITQCVLKGMAVLLDGIAHMLVRAQVVKRVEQAQRQVQRRPASVFVQINCMHILFDNIEHEVKMPPWHALNDRRKLCQHRSKQSEDRLTQVVIASDPPLKTL